MINIHSHYSAKEQEWTLQNLYKNFEQSASPGNYSIGLHPWYIDADGWQHQLKLLEQWSDTKNVLAIGECGLDKICATNFQIQKSIFTSQILLANQLRKPLMIHCVRAHEEVLQLLQLNNNQVPVIFHGFNKSSIVLAQQIIRKSYYLSFGTALQKPAMQKVLAALPCDNIFLETDDAELSINTVYQWAMDAMQIDKDSLSLQLQKNANRVFADKIKLV